MHQVGLWLWKFKKNQISIDITTRLTFINFEFLLLGIVAHAPVYAKAIHHDDEYDPNPQYSFAYDVQDGLTGDSKSQHETRSGIEMKFSHHLVVGE